MKTTHRLTVNAICPVDGTADKYEVAIEAGTKLVPVELILEHVAVATASPAYQEAITAALAAGLGVRVTTVGTHSGVETTCAAGG